MPPVLLLELLDLPALLDLLLLLLDLLTEDLDELPPEEDLTVPDELDDLDLDDPIDDPRLIELLLDELLILAGEE